ncbi:hypothetical protein HK104_002636 [Borealophlyctis nickersoniae]|nr:hypothetical protein HK104_002636 [Borealophlyctis nickersoniae]
METYPHDYVLHHVPLMAVIGLITPDPPPDAPPSKRKNSTSTLPIKKQLLSVLIAKNNISVWDAASGKGGAVFRVVVLDKSHLFPPKRRLPPTNTSVPTTHSHLSPLTPSSPLYPDGIMVPQWVHKHKEIVPAVVVGVYDLSDGVTSGGGAGGNDADPLGAQREGLNLERERDLILCSEVNEKKRNAAERGIKFALVLILKPHHMEEQHIEDRISFIRKQCGLDAKNALFVLPSSGGVDGAGVDLQEFVNTMQKALFEPALSYYREQTKRVKKKKLKLAESLRRGTSPSNLISLSSPTLPTASGAQAKPLPPAGWNLRYEYKLAVFAEFRQDANTAVSHYEAAYTLLMELFAGALAPAGTAGHNDLLQPFTSRWSEARVLADCINLKICKLYLYTDVPVPALQQLQKHLSNMRSLPEFAGNSSLGDASPGLSHLGQVPGGGSFEYWAWVSKQYRVFGELIEIATSKIGLKVPFPPPGSLPSAHTATGQAATLINTVANTAGNVMSGGDVPVSVFGPFSATNPALVVQHAGFYYFLAARCAEERWRRFKGAEKSMVSEPPALPSVAVVGRGSRSPFESSFSSLSLSAPISPLHMHNLGVSLAAERGVDHATQTIELLTKSYEQFKKHKSGRMTLFLASEIARAYEESGKYEMALKFFERIGKTYRKENWPWVLQSILNMSVRCARMLGTWDTVAECLVELLNERLTEEATERMGVLNDLLATLRGEDVVSVLRVGGVAAGGDEQTISVPRPPSLPKMKSTVDMDQINRFITCTIQFKKGTTYVGTPARFQILLAANGAMSPPAVVRFTRVRVAFSDPKFDHCFVDGGDENVVRLQESSRKGEIQFIDCTQCTKRPALGALSEGAEREQWVKQVDLDFMPGMRKVFEGEIVPSETGSEELRIVSVGIVLEGSTPGSGVELLYKIGERPEDSSTRRRWFVVDNDLPTRGVLLDGYGEQAALRVLRRQPNLSIDLQHTPPGYIDEVYPVTISVTNGEQESVYAFLEVEFRGSGTDAADPSCRLATDPKSIADGGTSPENRVSGIDLGVLPAGSKVERRLYLQATAAAGERVLYTTVLFRTLPSSSDLLSSGPIDPATHPDSFFRKNETVRIPFSKCFDASFEAHVQSSPALEGASEAGLLAESGQGMELNRVERYLVVGSVKCLGPWDVEVADTEFVKAVEEEPVSHQVEVQPVAVSHTDSPTAWQSGHVFSYTYRVKVTLEAISKVSHVSLGSLVLRWRRERPANEEQGEWTQSTILISKLQLSSDDIRVHVRDLPADAQVGTLFTLQYTLHNTTLTLADLQAHIEVTDAFVFSGYKQASFRMLPLATHTLWYNCLPLVSGRCAIPKLRIVRKGGTAAGDKEVVVGSGGELAVFVKPRVGW